MSDPFSPLPTEVFGADLSALQPEAIREFAMVARLGNLAYEQQRRGYREENPHVSREALAETEPRVIGWRFSHCATCDLNPWIPMSDALALKHIGKLGEEVCECGAAIFRCVIQGVDECESVTGKPNREWLEDEIADVLANIDLVTRHFRLDRDRMAERVARKQEHLRGWHSMIEPASPDLGAKLAVAEAEWKRCADHLRSFAQMHPMDGTAETAAILWCAEHPYAFTTDDPDVTAIDTPD